MKKYRIRASIRIEVFAEVEACGIVDAYAKGRDMSELQTHEYGNNPRCDDGHWHTSGELSEELRDLRAQLVEV